MLAYPVFSCWYLWSYCMPLTPTTFPTLSIAHPTTLLCCVYLSLHKVSRLWIYASLIHAKLVHLHWIPVIKAAFRLTHLISTDFLIETRGNTLTQWLNSCWSRFEIWVLIFKNFSFHINILNQILRAIFFKPISRTEIKFLS